MRRPRRLRFRRRRSLSQENDPRDNPRPGCEELEAWDMDTEDWMYGSPGSNLPPGGVK